MDKHVLTTVTSQWQGHVFFVFRSPGDHRHRLASIWRRHCGELVAYLIFIWNFHRNNTIWHWMYFIRGLSCSKQTKSVIPVCRRVRAGRSTDHWRWGRWDKYCGHWLRGAFTFSPFGERLSQSTHIFGKASNISNHQQTVKVYSCPSKTTWLLRSFEIMLRARWFSILFNAQVRIDVAVEEAKQLQAYLKCLKCRYSVLGLLRVRSYKYVAMQVNHGGWNDRMTQLCPKLLKEFSFPSWICISNMAIQNLLVALRFVVHRTELKFWGAVVVWAV